MSSGKEDRSNGYEEVAAEFLRLRESAAIGLSTIVEWAGSLPPGGSILDLGCGSGVPVSEALLARGFVVSGIEASPTLAAAFRQRFPDVPLAFEAIEDSDFFGRSFDGVVAIGVLFLLTEETQRATIRKVASALAPGGRFLFNAPAETCTWIDVLTGRPSWSLGKAGYSSVFAASGLTLVGESEDEGGNHYFETRRLPA